MNKQQNAHSTGRMINNDVMLKANRDDLHVTSTREPCHFTMLTTLYLNTEGNYIQPKTPAHNTKNRGENVYQGSITVQNGKGKVNAMRTPFHPKTTKTTRM